jgi:hypothetical protein
MSQDQIDSEFKAVDAEMDRLGEIASDEEEIIAELYDIPEDERDDAWVEEMKRATKAYNESSDNYDKLLKRYKDLKSETTDERAWRKRRQEEQEQKKAEQKAREEELAKQPKRKYRAPRKPKPGTAARVRADIKEIEELEAFQKALGFEIIDEETGEPTRDPSVVERLEELNKQLKELEEQEKKAAREKPAKSGKPRKKRSFSHRLMELRKAGLPISVAIRMSRDDGDD